VSDPAFDSAGELARRIRSGETSSRDLLEHYLERVERLGPRVHAVVTLDADHARKRADEADAARDRGEIWGPLHGLPITVKDCLEAAGLRTTAGATRYADHVPDEDAVAVARLRAAGAIVFGKTNTPAMAMDWQTYNDVFGTTCNPWDADRAPGGSSGGSAAAVAAGLSALELGSDIGGSIRIPAHCCGVFGHKPSWGLIPLRGFIPGPPGCLADHDINVLGPLARSAGDLELALGVLAGPAPDRATAWKLQLPPPRADSLAGYRVAVWLDDPDFPVDDTVRTCLESRVEELARAGAKIDDTARPDVKLADAVALYRRLLAPVTGLGTPEAEVAALAQQAEAGPAEDETFEFLRYMAVRHMDWLSLNEQREQMRARWAEFFREWDQTRPYMDHFAWMGPIGAALLPASVAPAGRTPAGLPVGVQIVAPYLEDRTAIDFAARIEREIGGFVPPPAFSSSSP
jgi:amidase